MSFSVLTSTSTLFELANFGEITSDLLIMSGTGFTYEDPETTFGFDPLLLDGTITDATFISSYLGGPVFRDVELYNVSLEFPNLQLESGLPGLSNVYGVMQAFVESEIDSRFASAVDNGLTLYDYLNFFIDYGNESSITGTADNDGIRIATNGAVVNSGGGDDIVINDGVGVTINTGFGNDFVEAGDFNTVTVDLGVGQDQFFGSRGNDLARGGSNTDLLVGNGGADWLFGNGGDDVLVGAHGWDRLNGGFGDDILLAAQTGRDIMNGGSGADGFAFIFDTPVYQAERAVVIDFNLAEDSILMVSLPSGGYNATDSYTEFMDHAMQNGSDVVYDNGYGVFQINNVLLEDLTMDNFQSTGLIDDVIGLLS